MKPNQSLLKPDESTERKLRVAVEDRIAQELEESMDSVIRYLRIGDQKVEWVEGDDPDLITVEVGNRRFDIEYDFSVYVTEISTVPDMSAEDREPNE